MIHRLPRETQMYIADIWIFCTCSSNPSIDFPRLPGRQDHEETLGMGMVVWYGTILVVVPYPILYILSCGSSLKPLFLEKQQQLSDAQVLMPSKLHFDND